MFGKWNWDPYGGKIFQTVFQKVIAQSLKNEMMIVMIILRDSEKRPCVPGFIIN
jgi:hypothetical protein